MGVKYIEVFDGEVITTDSTLDVITGMLSGLNCYDWDQVYWERVNPETLVVKGPRQSLTIQGRSIDCGTLSDLSPWKEVIILVLHIITAKPHPS